jgi:hypothetical protein
LGSATAFFLLDSYVSGFACKSCADAPQAAATGLFKISAASSTVFRFKGAQGQGRRHVDAAADRTLPQSALPAA